MHRFKNILYVNEPGNSSTEAPQRVVNLARNNGAQLTLCDAHSELPDTMATLQETFKQIHREQLLSSFEDFDLSGIKTKTLLLTGIPFVEIIKQVQRGGHDLVIKSAEGSGGVLGSLFGEIDMLLMRKCPCPVWIVKPSQGKTSGRIFAAVDPDPEIPANAELNTRILELATSLARQDSSELHIAHTWNFPYEDKFRSIRAGLKASEVDKIEAEIERNHRDWLDNLLALHDFSGFKVKVHLAKGEPGKLIPKMIADEQSDIVVMGTVARTGIAGFFIGNTAEKILRTVDCSVLTIKPKAFTTPVRI